MCIKASCEPLTNSGFTMKKVFGVSREGIVASYITERKWSEMNQEAVNMSGTFVNINNMIQRWKNPERSVLLPTTTRPGRISELRAVPKWTSTNVDKLLDTVYELVPYESRSDEVKKLIGDIEIDYWTWGVSDDKCKRLVQLVQIF